VAVVIERLTGVRLALDSVKRLLRERLGWKVQHPQAPSMVGHGSDPAGRLLSPAGHEMLDRRAPNRARATGQGASESGAEILA
jgi:hypothetical protein